MILLRQSTASQEIPLGYFVDVADGDTEKTSLTIANTDIKLWKSGATSLANKNSGGATHISNGIYYAVLDATDTNTLGSLVIFVHVAGALTVRVECLVLPAVVYDSLIAGTDYLQIDAVQLGGSAQSLTDLKDFADTGYNPVSHVATANSTYIGGSSVLPTNLVKMFVTDYASLYDTVNKRLAASAAALTAGAQSDVRSAVGLASANLDTQIGDVPTNAELSAALAAADDAVLAAVAALNNLDAAGVRTAIGLAAANLDTQLSGIQADLNNPDQYKADVSALALEATVSGLNNLAQADVRTAVGLASANLDTQLGTLATSAAIAALNDPTAAEIAAAVLSLAGSSVEGSAGIKSLAAMLALLLNKKAIDGNDLVVYKNDGTTEYFRIALTTDATASPIVGTGGSTAP